MDLGEAVAANIRRKRHDREWTQEELAHRAELSTRYVGKIERGHVSPTINVLGRIADALGIDPCDLMRRK